MEVNNNKPFLKDVDVGAFTCMHKFLKYCNSLICIQLVNLVAIVKKFYFPGEFPEVQTNPGVTHQFKVGDKVRVDLECDILKIMQEGHGGWNPRMAEVKQCT